MTTINKDAVNAVNAAVENKKPSLAADVVANIGDNAAANRDRMKVEGMPERENLIKEAYKVAKADHKVKAMFFVYYVTQIVKRGATLETTLPFFEQEIETMFEDGALKAIDADDNSDAVNAGSVKSVVRRMLGQAKARHDKAKNTNEGKGADSRKNDIPAKTFFASTSLADIAEGFQLTTPERKDKIIRAMFLQMDLTERAALLLELEAIKDAPVPEIEEVK